MGENDGDALFLNHAHRSASGRRERAFQYHIRVQEHRMQTPRHSRLSLGGQQVHTAESNRRSGHIRRDVSIAPPQAGPNLVF